MGVMPRYYIAVLARGLGLLDRFTRYEGRALPLDHHGLDGNTPCLTKRPGHAMFTIRLIPGLWNQ
jgi:hypothetical protein